MKNKFITFINQSFISTGKYFIGKTITSLIIGVVSFVVFTLLDIKLSWLIALIFFIANFIPIFGPWAGAILGGIIVIFQAPLFALYVIITSVLLQLIEQFLLIPLIIGKAIDLKPLIIVVVLILASLFLGFWGVLFAIPIASVIQIGYNIFIKKEEKK
ncbi:MAG: AI-2E family transporter [Clostridia bacterium]|nr:AI-2E family transporter [Clostridia bacterium]